MTVVSVIVPIFGDRTVWGPLAARAIQSARRQTVVPEVIFGDEGDTLAEARNWGAAQATSDWLIFLDADDELDPHYVEAMLEGEGDIRQPSTLGVVDGVEDDYPVLIEPKSSYMIGNHLVVGSMMRRKQFIAAGIFRELPVLEDWDLFIRMQLNGAQVGACPDAIYRVHVQPESRNQDAGLHGRIYTQIQQQYQTEWRQKGLK